MLETPTVFVVDDDPVLLASLSGSLKMRGYNVASYSSGEAFLDAYGAGQSGCIVLDFGLPRMSGLDVQASLIANNIVAQIIFITGHGGIPESVKATQLGAVDFLEKPYHPQTLVERIEEALKMDRLEQERRENQQNMARAIKQLTGREKEIFDLIIEQPELSSSKGLALKLNISPRTIDKHRAQILLKLNCRTLTDLIARFSTF